MYKVTIDLKHKREETEFKNKGSAERFFKEKKKKYHGSGILMVISELSPDNKWLMIQHN